MEVAICEDNIAMAGKLEMLVHECFGQDTNQYTCDIFLSGEELLTLMESEKKRYQIYILDIEMREIDGLQVASIIRKADSKAIIIFVTSHSELMQEAFEVVAFHYLLKPIDEEKTKQVLLRAIESLNINNTLFRFTKRKKVYSLYTGDIHYFESNGRKITVHTEQDAHEYYGTLKELGGVLSSQLFAQVHNSYVVNMDFVKIVDGECVVMKSGTQIMITKKYYKTFTLAYRNYVLKRVL